jgi:hypothetical protein
MLAADQSTKILPVSLSTALRPIHRSTISVHHAKQGYDYPMIRLPHTLSKLIGLPTQIYQTIYDGALAFLVVVAPPREAPKMSTKPLSLHGGDQEFESPRAHRFFFQSEARIKPEAEDDEDEKLHNSSAKAAQRIDRDGITLGG